MMLKYQPCDPGSAAAIVSGKALEKQSGRSVICAISPKPADEDAHAAPCGEICIRHLRPCLPDRRGSHSNLGPGCHLAPSCD